MENNSARYECSYESFGRKSIRFKSSRSSAPKCPRQAARGRTCPKPPGGSPSYLHGHNQWLSHRELRLEPALQPGSYDAQCVELCALISDPLQIPCTPWTLTLKGRTIGPPPESVEHMVVRKRTSLSTSASLVSTLSRISICCIYRVTQVAS